MDQLKPLIGKVATGASLDRDEAALVFDRMMSGEATPSQMGALLMGLRVRGETVEEIAGSRSMRTPSAVSTSAAPEREESARLPCLATGTPAPATIKEAQVEML